MALTNHQRLLFDLLGASLESGLGSRDAFTRATAAYEWYRSSIRTGEFRGMPQGVVKPLLLSALRSRGAETGLHLSARAVVAARLMTEYLEIKTGDENGTDADADADDE